MVDKGMNELVFLSHSSYWFMNVSAFWTKISTKHYVFYFPALSSENAESSSHDYVSHYLTMWAVPIR